jgi:F0F1-type ATP synthase assembly protein I
MALEQEKSPIGRGFGAGYAIVGAGFQFAFAILLFLGGGFLVDRWLGTRPLFTLLGVAIGLAAGFYAFILRVMAESRRGSDRAGPRQ